MKKQLSNIRFSFYVNTDDYRWRATQMITEKCPLRGRDSFGNKFTLAAKTTEVSVCTLAIHVGLHGAAKCKGSSHPKKPCLLKRCQTDTSRSKHSETINHRP